MIQYTARITSQDTPRVGRNLVYDAQKMTTNRDYKTRIVQLDKTHEFEVGADYIISFYSNRMPSNPNYLYFFNSNHNTQFDAKYLDRDKDGRTYYRLTWRTQYPGQTIVADNTCINIFNADNRSDTQYDFSIWDIKLEQGDTPTAYIPHPKDLAPVLTLDSQYHLLADGEMVSMQSLRGEAGHSPAPEDVLHAQGFQEMLDGAVWDEVKPVRDDLSTANTNIADLSNRSLTLQQKEDLVDITDSLQVLRSGSNNTLEGLALQRIIALSGDGANVSAYIASKPMDTALKAGITNFGTPQEREEVAINHNGTGHLGNLYFAGNQIDFRTDEHTDPYLSIGAEESQFIGDFLRTARVDQQVVYASSVTLTTSTTSYERTVDVANDGTRLTVTIDSIKIETYGSAKTRLTLDGEVLAEWRGKEYKNHGGSLTGGDIEITQEPYTASDLSYERVVKAGRHAIRLEIVQPTDGATANIKELRVRRRYDTGAQQSLLTKSGLRLFGSPDRYLDVDYRTTYRAELSNGRFYYYPNAYLVRIKGGAKVDKLTADELDMPGVPLCGASFDASGSQVKAFGKYANKQGSNRAQAVYYDSGRFFRVYHSIGHTNYIPTVQVIGDNGNDINWSLAARIYAVNANDFAVRIITNGDNPIRHAFSFVAFKTM